MGATEGVYEYCDGEFKQLVCCLGACGPRGHAQAAASSAAGDTCHAAAWNVSFTHLTPPPPASPTSPLHSLLHTPHAQHGHGDFKAAFKIG